MAARSGTMNSFASLLKGDGSQQFTWMEMLFLPLLLFSYLFGYAVSSIIVVQKLSVEQAVPPQRYLYPALAVGATVLAALGHLCFNAALLTPFEIRIHLFRLRYFRRSTGFYRAAILGWAERNDPDKGIRFLEECVKAGLLRLCDSLICDVPFLVLLLMDDVWTMPNDWVPAESGELQLSVSLRYRRWKIFRLLFLQSKVAQTLAFCSVMLKRQQHVTQPSRYRDLPSSAARQGRLNFFATLLLFSSHLTFTASRALGYSLAASGRGWWVLAVVAGRWLTHFVWHSISTQSVSGNAKPCLSIITGVVWLLALTNPVGEQQLGRLTLFAMLAVLESVICAVLWRSSVASFGSPFRDQGVLLLAVTVTFWLLLHTVYYSCCHPSNPRPSKGALFCCSSPLNSEAVERTEENEGDTHEIENNDHSSLNRTEWS